MLPNGLVMIHRRLLQVYNEHQTSAMADKHDVFDCIVAVHCDLHHHSSKWLCCIQHLPLRAQIAPLRCMTNIHLQR